MIGSRRERIVRLAADFAVIFVSVVLALIADDWRDRRNERAEGIRALQLIARDLQVDARDLGVYRNRLAAQEAGARAFLRQIDNGVAKDSLEASLNAALELWNYRPTYPAFKGVMQSGRLHLLGSDIIRDSIVSHYDDGITYLDDLRASVALAHDRALQLLQRHIAPLPDTSPRWPYRIVANPAVLASDREAMHALATATQARAWLRYRIENMFIPDNEALERAVRESLAR